MKASLSIPRFYLIANFNVHQNIFKALILGYSQKAVQNNRLNSLTQLEYSMAMKM